MLTRVKWRKLVALPALMLLLVSFQNCSTKVFYSSESPSSRADHSYNPNNGEGYDGKTSYTFYDDANPCPESAPGSVPPNGVIEVRVNQAALVRSQCQDVAQAIPISSLQFASDGSGNVTYQGNTYSVLVATAASCPSGMSSAPAGSQSTGVSFILPGRIEVENYDPGGEGLGYHDTTLGNMYGAYRSNDVDIGSLIGGSNGFAIGSFEPGEWMSYTVNVAKSGNYVVSVAVASPNSGSMHIEVDGLDMTGSLTGGISGGWESYTHLVSQPFPLTQGVHKITAVMDISGLNVDYLDFCY